ncbi:protein of unknown function [Candidatus Nitrosocosmicus franklandus]|uniref:Uncharacterized protein n=1 Tax=Candidatus Nitrosocosmicus franklandianus TaxID=1798806 RepID=A0A484IAH0_9ARCH|nr:protein of unknown function [Candidatus Nitrosocosmicus franklandus]
MHCEIPYTKSYKLYTISNENSEIEAGSIQEPSFGRIRKPWAGIEPATFALPRQRSGQAELPRQITIKKLFT